MMKGDACDVCPLDPNDVCKSDQTASGIILPAGGTTLTTMTGASLTCPAGSQCGSCNDAMKSPCATDADCSPGNVCGATSFSITGLNQSTCGTSSFFCAGNTGSNLVGAVAEFGPPGRLFNSDPVNHPERDVTIELRWLDGENMGAGDGNVNDRNNPAANSLPLVAETDLKPFRDGKFLGTCSIAPQVICTGSDLPCPTGAGTCNDGKKCSQFPACPAASSAICCDTTNNKFVLKTYIFSEYAVGLDPCDPITNALLKLTRIGPPAGDDKLTFKGMFTLAPPTTIGDLDPLLHGLTLVLSDAPGPVVDLTIPPDPYDPVARAGWKVNGAGTKWIYLNKSAPPSGIFKVLIKDQSTRAPGLVQFLFKGKLGSYAASSAVTATVVLPNGNGCFVADFPGPRPQPVCTANGATALTCK
jgi:hypothetical protein